MMLLPKFLGILPFDQANQGAQEAAAELQNPTAFDFVGPTAENSVAGQIEFVTNAPTGGYNVVMLSNNAGDQIVPAAEAAQAAGTKVVTWDSPIPIGRGREPLRGAGGLRRDRPGDGRHGAAPSSARRAASSRSSRRRRTPPTRTPGSRRCEAALADPKYANLELLETVYGDDQSEKSYEQAAGADLQVPGHEADHGPDLGRASWPRRRRCRTRGCARTIKVSGLGVPAEMVEYTLNGCAPEFALWSFVDLGYLTYYASYLLATGAIQGVEGETFTAGRMGEYTITDGPDPTGHRRAAAS